MQTRYERKMDRQSKFLIGVFLVGSVVLIGLFLYFGVPALFTLASTISGIGKKEESGQEEKIILNAPSITSDFEATKSATITVRGKADPESSVELSRNTISLGIEKASFQGNFTFSDVSLEKGRNEFIAKTVKNGKESEASESYVVYFSTSGPKMELSNKDGDTVHDSPYSFNGKVDPVTATVTVNGNLAIVDSQGNFSYYMNLNEGENKITVLATDEAGNETKQDLTLKYEK